jgi:predicted nucleic acid-binding protein
VIVVDASVVVHLITDAALDPNIVEIIRRAEKLIAPHIIDLEVLNVLRKKRFQNRTTSQRLELSFQDFNSIPIDRISTSHLNNRIWELCHNLTPYDASYIALAESYDVSLLSRDAKMAGAPLHRANIIIV